MIKLASCAGCRASNLSMSQGYTLLCYRGMEGGGRFLGWIVREGKVKKSIQGEKKKLDECHHSRQRLEERGWERIKAVRIEGREVKQP